MEIITFRKIDSTNTYLKNNYNKYKDFTVIRAKTQTSGRGRFDRTWISKKDLTFSILFKKSLPHHFIAPLAVNHALTNLGVNSTIKWPNDILVDDIKISGILIERVFEGNNSNDIVGIGINVDYREDFNYLTKYIKIKIKNLLNEVLNMYKFFASLDLTELRRYYIHNSSILEKTVIFKNRKYKVIDINDNGELIINNDKETKIVNANEIDYTTMIISK